MEPRLVLDCRAELGEGPSWDSRIGKLFWVDIFRGEVHLYDPAKRTDSKVAEGQYASCVVPKGSGGAAVTLQHGFYNLDAGTGELSLIAEVEKGSPENRFNDGKCDPAGRFWAGTMDIREASPSGALYTLEGDRIRKVLDRVTISNGLGWSPDGRTMYYIDSATRKVDRLDYDVRTGEAANRKTVVDFADQPGDPDGMAVDGEGMIWVAHWGGWRVTRFDPASGMALETVPLPAAQVTSCCFGGEGLRTLYVTTARSGLGEDSLASQPYAGGLFEVDVGVSGLQTQQFKG
jgi:sugar lactone lactonase YvrE